MLWLLWTMLVVDASIIAPVVADGGADGTRYRHRLRGERLVAPDLMRIEVLSVLRRQLRQGSLAKSEADAAVGDLLSLAVEILPTVTLVSRIWELRDNVTTYDACYVALAESLGCALLTADGRLARASGPRCKIELV
jgi:predicted nucleic acid-binding protein